MIVSFLTIYSVISDSILHSQCFSVYEFNGRAINWLK